MRCLLSRVLVCIFLLWYNIVMEQYPVPQFIEEESRMTVFLTMKQFVYLVIAGGLIFLLYHILPPILFYPLAFTIGGVAIVVGFIKIDGIPLITILLNSIGFASKTREYTWKKKETLYPFKTVQRAPLKKIQEEKKLGTGQQSHLKKLRTRVELNIK